MKKKPDCSGVELSGGDVKDGEGSGGAELAKENQDGEGDTLQGERDYSAGKVHFMFLVLGNLLKDSSRDAASAW